MGGLNEYGFANDTAFNLSEAIYHGLVELSDKYEFITGSYSESLWTPTSWTGTAEEKKLFIDMWTRTYRPDAKRRERDDYGRPVTSASADENPLAVPMSKKAYIKKQHPRAPWIADEYIDRKALIANDTQSEDMMIEAWIAKNNLNAQGDRQDKVYIVPNHPLL